MSMRGSRHRASYHQTLIVHAMQGIGGRIVQHDVALCRHVRKLEPPALGDVSDLGRAVEHAEKIEGRGVHGQRDDILQVALRGGIERQ